MTLIGGEEIAAIAIVFGTVSATVVALAKLWIRRLESRDAARGLTGEADDRLFRIEQAVDAIAIEVERLSESQRFTAKILADRLPPAAPPGGALRGSST